MSRIFLDNGDCVPVTYLTVEPNTVVRIKRKEKDGYDAVVLGVGAKTWKTRKGKELVRFMHQKEWQVESLDGMEQGKTLTLELIPAESLVTICGTGKGKGFQGVMKRHHFGGGPATHGSHFKREPGSVGMRTKPGRILKGHRMAGRMGGEQVTLKHRMVMALDPEKNVIAVSGPVPGPRGSAVYLTVEVPAKK
jgi:large subunit ribosomal protein L3